MARDAAPTRGRCSILPGSTLTAAAFDELFDSQLASRQLDLMARVLRVQNKVFYTIGSSGHEGNALLARAAGIPTPFLHYRSARLHGRAFAPGAGHRPVARCCAFLRCLRR